MYTYYRMSKHMEPTEAYIDSWFHHHDSLGVPVAEVVYDMPGKGKQSRVSIWVIGDEQVGPDSYDKHKNYGPNNIYLDKACITREANGFSEMMGEK